MIEALGPHMARTIMGDAFNPDFRYELETDDEGFHVIVTNTETGESSSVKLDPEPVDEQKLTAIWSGNLDEGMPKKDTLSKLLFWCCIAAVVVIVALVLLWR